MGVVFDSDDTRPLTEQIEKADGGPVAWAEGYAAWVYATATQALNAYMASAPWRSGVRFHALRDYREHVIPTDEGDIHLSLMKWGRTLTLDPAIFKNDDQVFLRTVPDKMALAIMRTIDGSMVRLRAAIEPGDTVHVALRHDPDVLHWLLWRNDDPGGKPWAMGDPLVFGWSFDFGVTALVGEMEPVTAS